MTPQEIAQRFGDETLARLYDDILDNPVHQLATWILHFYNEEQIKAWIEGLNEEQE